MAPTNKIDMHGTQVARMSSQVVFTGSLRDGFSRHRGIEELPAGLALPDYSAALLQQCLARLTSGSGFRMNLCARYPCAVRWAGCLDQLIHGRHSFQ